MSTRQFLHLVHLVKPDIPLLALLDWDPDGIGIMLTYKSGSRNLYHEPNVELPGLIWLGVRSSCVLPRYAKETPSHSQNQGGSSSQPAQPSQDFAPMSILRRSVSDGVVFSRMTERTLIPLGKHDRRKAVSILTRFTEIPDPDTEQMILTRELQLMLLLNVKAEIQAVGVEDGMAAWLDCKITAEIGVNQWYS